MHDPSKNKILDEIPLLVLTIVLPYLGYYCYTLAYAEYFHVPFEFVSIANSNLTMGLLDMGFRSMIYVIWLLFVFALILFGSSTIGGCMKCVWTYLNKNNEDRPSNTIEIITKVFGNKILSKGILFVFYILICVNFGKSSAENKRVFVMIKNEVVLHRFEDSFILADYDSKTNTIGLKLRVIPIEELKDEIDIVYLPNVNVKSLTDKNIPKIKVP